MFVHKSSHESDVKYECDLPHQQTSDTRSAAGHRVETKQNKDAFSCWAVHHVITFITTTKDGRPQKLKSHLFSLWLGNDFLPLMYRHHVLDGFMNRIYGLACFVILFLVFYARMEMNLLPL